MKNKIFIVLFAVIVISGCISNSENSNDAVGNAIINQGVDNTMTAKNGDTIKVDYVGTLEDGTVFDTSIEQIAKESGNHQEGRPYQPLEFKVGAGQMIAGFDAAVVGMKLDEEKTVTLPPAQAYGEINAQLVQEVPIENLKNAGIEPKAGMVISANGNPAKITKVENNIVFVDFNHELAGKTLIFKITLKEIV